MLVRNLFSYWYPLLVGVVKNIQNGELCQKVGYSGNTHAIYSFTQATLCDVYLN